jgi:CheY-like chemotaxis protein
MVAVVDDDASVRKAMGRLLTVAGLRVEAFASGEDFLASLSVRVPDCLILDLHMPGLTGVDVLRQIVRTQLRLPIVIITAFDESESKAQCLAAGACAYLQKPLDDRVLLDAVYTAVGNWPAKEKSMIEQLSAGNEKVLAFKLSGKLHDEDYKTFVPLVDAAIAKEGKARILAQFHDFHGWDALALWDDIKFSTTHCTKIERIALVGEKKWEKWMAAVCKPFTMAKIRYFDTAEIVAAREWLAES